MAAVPPSGDIFLPAVLSGLAWLSLIFALAVSPAFPEVANGLVLLTAALGFVMLIPALGRGKLRRGWPTFLPLAAMGLMVLGLIPTTQSPANFLVVLVLAPIWLSPGLATVILSLRRRLRLTNIAILALVGALVAAGIAGYDVLWRGLPRGGQLTMNVIHFGDLALILGFVALAGIFDGRSPWRALFLLGPAAALIAVIWSGSRGPLVVFGVMAVVAFIYGAALVVPPTRRVVALLASIGLMGAVLGHGLIAGWLMQIPGFDRIWEIFATGQTEDVSVNQRLSMYEGALKAFLASPLFGHGGETFVAVAADYAGVGDTLSQYDHLHSDLADFGVIGGSIGLLSYGLLITSPIALGFASRVSRGASIYLGTITSIAYFGMGLTNVMFGILVLTMLFGVVLSILMALSTEAPSLHT